MRAHFFGTRGSLPTPPDFDEFVELCSQVYSRAHEAGIAPDGIRDYLHSSQAEHPAYFGGNTSCIRLSSGDANLILDAGSGIRQAGNDIMESGQKEVHIIMSHVHWDHIQGLPFFTPLYVPGYTIHFYSARKDLADVFRRQMSSPTFPVPFDVVGSKIVYHTYDDGEVFDVNGFSVKASRLHHPDESYGFKVERDGGSFVYLTDTEVKSTELKKMEYYRNFIGDADIIVADSQYSFVEYFAKQAWGHSTSTVFIDILADSQAHQKLILFHHDPQASVERLRALGVQAKGYQNLSCPGSPVEILYAYDGLELDTPF